MPVVRSAPAAGEIGWDPHAGRLDPQTLVGIDAVVNLAGAGIGDKRWTDDYKRTGPASRATRATTLLAESMAAVDGGPATLLSGSAVGFYGDRGDEELDERSPAGAGFLTDVVEAWEASTAAAERAGVRVVHLRTGIVLAPKGGALAKLLPLFKVGLGGRFGSGQQWMSWIALDDEVGAIVHLLTSSLSGPVNLTAPSPVRNAELADTLGDGAAPPDGAPCRRSGRSCCSAASAPTPCSSRASGCCPRQLLADGFEFAHPTLERGAAGRARPRSPPSGDPARSGRIALTVEPSGRRDARPAVDLGRAGRGLRPSERRAAPSARRAPAT